MKIDLLVFALFSFYNLIMTFLGIATLMPANSFLDYLCSAIFAFAVVAIPACLKLSNTPDLLMAIFRIGAIGANVGPLLYGMIVIHVLKISIVGKQRVSLQEIKDGDIIGLTFAVCFGVVLLFSPTIFAARRARTPTSAVLANPPTVH